MTGRGIDQILAHPSPPVLYEPYVTDARAYVELAETVNGPIPKPVDDSYIWGDAVAELRRAAPDARIINLETAVTCSDEPWPGKGIHYRMHPDNVGCIEAAGIDCCVLANNHVLDWGRLGLDETRETLHRAHIQTTGCGTGAQAREPAIVGAAAKGRVLVFGFGSETSGIPRDWAASEDRSGVNLLPDLSQTTVDHIARQVRDLKRRGDVAVASIHWGDNWGYRVSAAQMAFAGALIDHADIDVVHGHSSHHPKGIEVHGGKLILYGCGDLLNDYEGISGYEEYRGNLSLMYFPRLEIPSGRLVELRMTVMTIERFRLRYASRDDAVWLRDVLDREGRKFDTGVVIDPDDRLRLTWGEGKP